MSLLRFTLKLATLLFGFNFSRTVPLFLVPYTVVTAFLVQVKVSPEIGDMERRNKERRRSRSPPPRHRRSRSRSPPPRRRRSRTRSRSRERSKEVVIIKDTKAPQKMLEKPQITDADLEGKTDEEIEMITLMGFGSFDSTKGKHVQGNDAAAVNTIHKRKYRQYMNRKGGFNRPLDFVA